MSVFVENITDVALSLPMNERTILANKLYESLEPVDEDPTIRQAWIDEAERRLEEVRSGAVEPIDAEIVFADVQNALNELRR